MREPKSPGQTVKSTGLRPRMQSVDWDNMWNPKTVQMNLYMKQEKTHRHRKQSCDYQRVEQLLIKGGAALKPPEARLKGPVGLIKIRRLDNLRPWTHPSLVSSPTLLKLQKKELKIVQSLSGVLFFESQVYVSLKTVTAFYKICIFINGCAGSSLLRAGFLWLWRLGVFSWCRA